jgi:pimeloyl-ACP methyl ester carboxylesterase
MTTTTSSKTLRFAVLSLALAAVGLAPACASDDEPTLSADAPEVNQQKTPGLPKGTVLVQRPKSSVPMKIVQIPTKIGFVKAELIGESGEVIVLINGGPGLNDEYIAKLHEGLAAKVPTMRVLRFNQRGTRGSSPTTSEQNKLAGTLDDIDSIREFLGVQKLHVLGQSFGGYYAVAYACAHPDRVSSLSLWDPAPPDKEAFAKGGALSDQKLADLIKAGILPEGKEGESDDEFANRTLGLYYANPKQVPAEAAAPPTFFSSAIFTDLMTDHEVNGEKLVANAGKLRMPIIIGGGNQSPFGTIFVDATERVFKDAKPTVLRIEGAGHEPWFEKPVEVFGALEKFYKGAASAK